MNDRYCYLSVKINSNPNWTPDQMAGFYMK